MKTVWVGKLGQVDVHVTTARLMPNVPFIYVPEQDWDRTVEQFDLIRQDLKCTYKLCYFEQTCSEIMKDKRDDDLASEFILEDNDGMEVELRLSWSEMLVNGTNVTNGEAGYCYLPMMSHKGDVWMLGAYLLHKYYMVFDATPVMPPYSQNYLRVGFFLAEHGEIDAGDEDNRSLADKLLKEYLPVIIAVGAILFIVIVGCCHFYCATMRRKAKIKKMSREELAIAV